MNTVYNDNYTEQQRQRDRKIYGQRAVNRINRRMNEGESIQSARHDEVANRKYAEAGKNILKKMVQSALLIGSGMLINEYTKKSEEGTLPRLSDTAILYITDFGKTVVREIFKMR